MVPRTFFFRVPLEPSLIFSEFSWFFILSGEGLRILGIFQKMEAEWMYVTTKLFVSILTRNCNRWKPKDNMSDICECPWICPTYVGQTSHTTQKGVEIKKIFELRAETRTECSLRCQMTIANKNFGCSAKPAARRGPKPVKKCHFEAINKKEKSKIALKNWLE